MSAYLTADQRAALNYFQDRLAHLNDIIEEGRTSQFAGVVAAAATLREHRDHLAALLDASGAAAAAMADVLLPDGTHHYWSTHCRHDPGDGSGHRACSATEISGTVTGFAGNRGEWVGAMRRLPARCKTCAAPCICPCHREGT